MKKTSLFAGLIVGVLFLASCQKEEEQCNCGTIANDGISTNADGSYCYWLEIRNDCSGNKKQFCFDQDVWSNNYVGDHFCVSNVTSW